jgi:RNA chaperone Hfq
MEMTDAEKPSTRPSMPQFIPKLKGKKVMIRLLSGGQPVVGAIDSFNSYEILLQTTKGELLVFKHAIATIEVVDEPRGYKPGN